MSQPAIIKKLPRGRPLKSERKTKEKTISRDVIYCYVSHENSEYARGQGQQLFGSVSAYVNALIEFDRQTDDVLKWARKKIAS
jgi:hypothetical protein